MRGGDGGTLLALFAVFAPLSLLSFGGSNAVLADIAQQSVSVHGWTSQREFADFFALSRAAPGPGSMLVALIGWKIAGLATQRRSRSVNERSGSSFTSSANIVNRQRIRNWATLSAG